MPTIPDTLTLALQHHQAGRLPEAEAIYRQILQTQPEHPDALHLLGLVAHQVGRHDVAVELIGKAITLNPSVEAFHNNIGEAYRAQGKFENAGNCYRQAVALKPDYAEAYSNLGLVLQAQGKLEEAMVHYRQAVTLSPAYAEAHNNLANALKAQGDRGEAEAHYRQALVHKPDYAEAHNNLGVTLQVREEAIRHLRRALVLKPAFPEASYNLGNVLQAQGKVEEAVDCYRQALSLRPDYTEAYYNLGQALHEQGKLEEAAGCYRQAVAGKPGFVEAYNNLGAVLAEQGKLAEAEKAYGHALALKPDSFQVHANLGGALVLQGKLKEGVDHYRQALALRPHDGMRILIATALPVIAESKARLQAARQSFREQVSGLSKRELALTDPPKEVNVTNFYLAYQGQNDRELQVKMAQLYERACPSLNYCAPHCRAGFPAVAGRKLRVGFISRFFGDHSIGKLMRGMIAELSRREFSVSVLSFPRQPDSLSAVISQCADRSIVVPPTLEAARQRIAEEQLDILFYTDIGMDSLTYFLAFSRLAPVQCTSWGHGVTTGIRTVDYFISSALSEPAHGERHYSERLVRLKHLPTYYERPASPGPLQSRRDLGLDDSRTLYVCPQSLFKIHPDFDEVLAGILQTDPRGEVILIEGAHPHWTELLVRRFRATIPAVAGRIRFVPRQSNQGFHSLIAVADVILDPLHCGGGNTTLDAFPAGVPIVTLPGEFNRSRTTYACYKQMGVLDCVAKTKKDYVSLAVRVGTDRAYRAEVQAKILAAHGVLYENAEAVRELERFFLEAIAQPGRPACDHFA